MSLDTLYWWYFITHIPITILMDSCIVLSPQNQFTLSKKLLEIQIVQNKDFLLATSPLWLKVFGLIELGFQLPFFFYVLKLMRDNNPKRYLLSCIYGFNASLTTLVCLLYVYIEGGDHGLAPMDQYKLIAVYFPYFIVPLIMMVDNGIRVNNIVSTHREKND